MHRRIPIMIPMSPIRLRVRELRKARGWTQVDLAHRAGVNQGTISRIEAGVTRGIDLDTLEKLARAFGVSPARLLKATPK